MTDLAKLLTTRLGHHGPLYSDEDEPALRMFKATVDATTPNLTIAYRGATGLRVSRLNGYTPTVSDVVVVLQTGASIIVLDKINNG